MLQPISKSSPNFSKLFNLFSKQLFQSFSKTFSNFYQKTFICRPWKSLSILFLTFSKKSGENVKKTKTASKYATLFLQYFQNLHFSLYSFAFFIFQKWCLNQGKLFPSFCLFSQFFSFFFLNFFHFFETYPILLFSNFHKSPFPVNYFHGFLK